MLSLFNTDYTSIDSCINIVPDCMSKILQDALEYGKEKNELVYTCGLRQIGKTHNLVKFAQKYGYWVIVPNKYQERYLKDKYRYNKILCIHKNVRGIGECVIDEGIYDDFNLDILQTLKIITGFTNVYKRR